LDFKDLLEALPCRQPRLFLPPCGSWIVALPKVNVMRWKDSGFVMVFISVHGASSPQVVHWMLNVDAGVSDHDSDIFLVVTSAGTWTGVATRY